MKRIVVCCDGTWNSPAQRFATNVFKFKSALLEAAPDGVRQCIYYDIGVGAGSLLERIPGLFGAGVGRNVQQAYRFVAENYEAGDELFFVGFSRGAYTVRSVVGMMRKCGILRRDNLDALKEAYRFYRDRRVPPGHDDALGFRRENSVAIPGNDDFVPPTRFMSVWDTVGTLGVPSGLFTTPVQMLLEFVFNRGIRFHDVALSRSVERAYQALAIDESRGDYQPTIWEQHPAASEQVLEQVWFAGAHTNIGGGAPDAEQSDHVLHWMASKAREADLAFDDSKLPAAEGNPEAPLHDSFVHIFKLRRFMRRPIGRGVPAEDAAYFGGRSCESVDPAVLRRHKANPDYHPPNLVTYYRENPDELNDS
ncbi:MAG TPA: DUF2235 domain-containing protein [Dehalococcoidia bacterium]|jgi:uncharacterized protein (DUF2235 family)|nr:DUF2235 domain-containing protein [Dehalococcoidia bacterium]